MTDEQFKELMGTLKSIDYYLGALASQGQKRLQIEARAARIPCRWHDPTIAPWPTVAHGEIAQLDELLIGVPRWQRKS